MFEEAETMSAAFAEEVVGLISDKEELMQMSNAMKLLDLPQKFTRKKVQGMPAIQVEKHPCL